MIALDKSGYQWKIILKHSFMQNILCPWGIEQTAASAEKFDFDKEVMIYMLGLGNIAGLTE